MEPSVVCKYFTKFEGVGAAKVPRQPNGAVADMAPYIVSAQRHDAAMACLGAGVMPSFGRVRKS